ncbi:MAG TPA: hypothetical protein PLD88_15420, partial [Candidatus Berkiella sp.]|nr:hypothetical protein [Candidatus Berkiella sp.]
FNEYLQGENGIGNVSVHAGDIELKVLSSKLGIVHKTFMRGAIEDERAATYYDGFQAEDKARKVGKNALIFVFEKSPIHWNCLLEDTPANNRIIQVYNAQRAELTKLEILEKHGTFKKHHAKNFKDLSIKEYCQIHNITRKEYNHPAKVKKAEEEKAKQAAKANADTDSKSSKTKGSPLNISANIEVSDYALYFMLTTAVIAVMSQFLLIPILTPALTSLFVGTKLASYVGTLAIGMVLGMSALAGYIVAEKIQNNNESVAPTKPSATTKNTADKLNNDVIDLTGKSPTMLIYQNTRAQAKRREQATVSDVLADRCTVRPTLH